MYVFLDDLCLHIALGKEGCMHEQKAYGQSTLPLVHVYMCGVITDLLAVQAGQYSFNRTPFLPWVDFGCAHTSCTHVN